jgi:glycosyltransferase involved in cell wall biosynthesis
MKILHIITSINRGGAENHLYDLTNIQRNNKHKVHVIYFKGDSYWEEKLKSNGISTTFLSIKGSLAFFKFLFNIIKISSFIKNFNPDIIHCHLSLSEIHGLLIKFLHKSKYKVIISKHLDSTIFEGSYGQRKIMRGTLLENIIFNRVDHVICISKHVKNYFSQFVNQKKNKVSIIHYGVKYDKLLNIKKIQKKYNFNKRTFYICNVARHIKQKNLFFLLDTFDLLLKKFKKKKFKLVLVGNGPENIRLKNYANRKGIYKDIIWINFSDNVREIISCSDIFCLTSDYEGLGLVMLEAMSVKKPIVATNFSAIPEVISNNYSGLLYKKQDKNSFMTSIQKILFDKKFSQYLTNNALKTLNKKFSQRRMYDEIMNTYNKVLKK